MPLRHQLLSLSTATLLALLAGACADEAGVPLDDSTDSMTESALIAEAPLNNGGSLRFYEPEPGVLVELKRAPIGAPRDPLDDERLSNAADKYEFLTGRPAPERLVAAAAAVEHVEAPSVVKSVKNALSSSDISRPGSRDEFLGLYCVATDRFDQRLGYQKTAALTGYGENYIAWGINSIQGSTHYEWNFSARRFGSDDHIEGDLPQGWYAGLVVKISRNRGADWYDLTASPVEESGMFDICLNYHY